MAVREPPDKRYELIEGVAHETPAIGPLQATRVRKLQNAHLVLEDDRKKLTVYAKAGIPKIWIVYCQLKGSRYLSRLHHDPAEPVAALAFPDTPLALSW